MSSSVIEGHCSRCHKIWTLSERQGICQWCGKLSSVNSTTSKPRRLKSNRSRQRKQTTGNGNGYDHLDGQWHTYYTIASRFAHKCKADDKQDMLHDIIYTLASVEKNNGHSPFTEAAMCRIASRTVADYWRNLYKRTNGLTCCHCSKEQRNTCKEEWLYAHCPKAIKLEYLSKPVIDADGNTTELGELIADDTAIDINAWHEDRTWELGYRPRLVAIAYKLHRGQALNNAELLYLSRLRKREQQKLLK